MVFFVLNVLYYREGIVFAKGDEPDLIGQTLFGVVVYVVGEKVYECGRFACARIAEQEIHVIWFLGITDKYFVDKEIPEEFSVC